MSYQPSNIDNAQTGGISELFSLVAKFPAAASIANVPIGTVSSTNVQAAINELDSEKVPSTRLVSTATDLAGGGDLSATRTIDLATALRATINADTGAAPEILALLGMIANGIWPVADDGLGGLIFPKTVRINGRTMFAVPSTAPTDADIPNGFAAPWVDETAHALVFRIRESTGALITRTVAT